MRGYFLFCLAECNKSEKWNAKTKSVKEVVSCKLELTPNSLGMLNSDLFKQELTWWNWKLTCSCVSLVNEAYFIWMIFFSLWSEYRCFDNSFLNLWYCKWFNLNPQKCILKRLLSAFMTLTSVFCELLSYFKGRGQFKLVC